MLTYGDQVTKLRTRFPRCGPNEAENLIWQAVVDLHNEHAWSFLITEGKIITEASYNTGTLSVTNGSNAVTVSVDATWQTSWTTGASTRKILIAGRPETYDLIVSGPNAGFLESAWIGDTNAAATYVMWRDIYALPVTCDFGREFFILQPALNRRISIVDYNRFQAAAALQQNSPGMPIAATRVGLTTNLGVLGVPQLKFGPNPPSSQEVYVVLFYASPVKPVDLGAFLDPIWPARAEDLIYRRARWQYAEDHDLPMTDRLKDVYLSRFFDLQSAFNGGNEMDRRIRSTIPNGVMQMSGNYPDSWFQGTFPGSTYP